MLRDAGVWFWTLGFEDERWSAGLSRGRGHGGARDGERVVLFLLLLPRTRVSMDRAKVCGIHVAKLIDVGHLRRFRHAVERPVGKRMLQA